MGREWPPNSGKIGFYTERSWKILNKAYQKCITKIPSPFDDNAWKVMNIYRYRNPEEKLCIFALGRKRWERVPLSRRIALMESMKSYYNNLVKDRAKVSRSKKQYGPFAEMAYLNKQLLKTLRTNENKK